jgi:hypothetical protein
MSLQAADAAARDSAADHGPRALGQPDDRPAGPFGKPFLFSKVRWRDGSLSAVERSYRNVCTTQGMVSQRRLRSFGGHQGPRPSGVPSESPGPNLTLYDTTHMGRTIHYDVFGDLEDGPVPEQTRQRIMDVQRIMNHDFTWTCENLSLELFEHCQITYGVDPPIPWAARLGWGFTKVAADEWNAALVVRFIRWVSTQLPDRAFIRLHDEGNYVIPGFVIVNRGDFDLDTVSIDRHRAYLRAHAREYLPRMDECEAEARRGHWLRPVPVLEYYDRHRRDLHRAMTVLSGDEFFDVTLEEAARETIFPWQA